MNLPEGYAGTDFKPYKYGSKKKASNYAVYLVVKKLEDTEQSTSLHLFPKDKKQRHTWAIKCRIGVQIKDYFAVCNHHFEATDFHSGVDQNNRKRTLKNGVVPSKNLPKPSFADYPRKPGSMFNKLDIATQTQARQFRSMKRDTGCTTLAEIPSTTEALNVIECAHISGRSDQVPNDSRLSSAELVNAAEPSSSAERDTVLSSIQTEKTFKDASIQVNTIEDFLPKFTVFDFITSDTKLNSWTGLPSFQLLDAIEDCLYTAFPDIITRSKQNKCTVRERIVLCFIKLKTNMSFVCLAHLFNVSNDTVSRVFAQMISFLSEALKPLIYFPTVEENKANMPIAFVKYGYQNVRTIIDCSEVKIQAMKCVNCRISTYSPYKKDYTMKFMINITPGGLISDISDAYSGKASDKFIFNEEQLIEKFDCPDDAIMVDKGVMIEDEVIEHELTLIRPSFFRADMEQFEEEEAVKNTRIAALRVHVERALQRMKIFAVMTDKMEYNLHPYVNDILIVVAAVANLTKPILAADKF